MPDGPLLDDLVFDTAKAMRAKLREKSFYMRGWSDPAIRGHLAKKLREHVKRAGRDPEQWLDVANFAAMLWHGRKKHDAD